MSSYVVFTVKAYGSVVIEADSHDQALKRAKRYFRQNPDEIKWTCRNTDIIEVPGTPGE